MITEALSTFADPAKGVLEPMQRFNQTAVATAEKLCARQIASLTMYSKLSLDQLKAAAKVQDVEGLQTLMSNQQNVVREFSERFLADMKAVTDMGIAFVTEARQVGAASVPEVLTKATAKKAS
jgi:phasin family protein